MVNLTFMFDYVAFLHMNSRKNQYNAISLKHSGVQTTLLQYTVYYHNKLQIVQ
jgi:hypothetical protein